jgi:hypothetical protein
MAIIKKNEHNIPPFMIYSLKHKIIQKLVRLNMELSKINKVARFMLNSTIALGYYSLTASNEEAIVRLIKKNIEPQKEKIEKLITFGKKKIEENTEITEENLDYDGEYKEIKKLLRKEEIEQKEKTLKF